MSLGDMIRTEAEFTDAVRREVLEGIAYQVDVQASVVVREREVAQQAVNANLDLIKRLKDAQAALDATFARLEAVHHYLDSAESFGDELDANRIRTILEG